MLSFRLKTFFFICSASCLAAISESTLLYREYDYPRALTRALSEKRKKDLTQVLKISELKLIVEGRASSQNYLLSQMKVLPKKDGQILVQKLNDVSEMFLTDDGEALFYQGLVKSNRSMCQTALPQFIQSAQVETGNTLVLREKAKCETEAKLYPEALKSWKVAFELNPFSQSHIENYFEQLYFANSDSTIRRLASEIPDSSLSSRSRVVLSLVLLDSGEWNDLWSVLRSYPDKKTKNVDPVLYYVWGKSLLVRNPKSKDGFYYLERFLKEAKTLLVQETFWDKYRFQTKIKEVEERLSRI